MTRENAPRRDIRNRLLHGYDTVDSEIVWELIQTRLPQLGHDAERLLGDIP